MIKKSVYYNYKNILFYFCSRLGVIIRVLKNLFITTIKVYYYIFVLGSINKMMSYLTSII